MGKERLPTQNTRMAPVYSQMKRSRPALLRLLLFAFVVTAGFQLIHAAANPNPGAGAARTSPNDILVGEFASLTGKEAVFGQSSHEGTLLAIEELNAAGGVLDRKFTLVTEDNQSKAGESARVVKKLIADGVVAILGEVASSRSLEAATVCQQNGIPMISPASTNPKVTETGDFIFRVCFIDPFQGTIMAGFARKTLKAQKVAVFTDLRSDYSKGLEKSFKEEFTAAGGRIVSDVDYWGGDKDFGAQLTSIKTAAPDAVFLPGYYTDAALICIQARELGLNVPIFGCDGWESEKFIEIGRAAVEGTYFSSHYAPEAGGAKGKAFVEAYRKRFDGKEPDVIAALGYDSAIILADAIKRAGSTHTAKIRDALGATKEFDAVTGRISINRKRDAEKPAVIFQVRDGKFSYLETVAP
jgi:branched-chain amino acid transport system substrate-binding protein